ncbi:ROK family transcriptional regulator [Actinocorallia sp. A-T 12471]|uniref:ROK family transcriptional regulator n=1 Tax=Actinocorallia sp. A-T 12471 TaxID=3089813 RepID=UPI0029CDBBD0|nr:ROK family transcriptional regulator [Actinocorallia sp. A-T 12471]MDX6743441.1 ROK family transcriptional regulator [Actinocorallia sp. A-T 12471]
MARRPGTPRLLRELNDRAALELLIGEGPLTRAQIGDRTGLSKVTASQLLGRLEERGLVQVVGEQAGGRGPNAALYAVVPSAAFVAGLEVGPEAVIAGIADITGAERSRAVVALDDGADPVQSVHAAVAKACRSAKVPVSALHAFVIGTPGVVDPRTGDVRFAFDLPAWHEGVLDALRRDLGRPVIIENDVNLVAVAEREHGAARDVADFALVWIDRGLGLAVMMGDRLHRGVSGGAGEIGYLPVPGAALPEGVTESVTYGQPALAGGFGSLVGADAVVALAAEHGIAGKSALEAVAEAAAVDSGPAADFLDALATRLALGVAAVNIVLDLGLVVVTGALGAAGGAPLARRVEHATARISPTRPRVVPGQLTRTPVLQGALHTAVAHAREEVFSTTTD